MFRSRRPIGHVWVCALALSLLSTTAAHAQKPSPYPPPPPPPDAGPLPAPAQPTAPPDSLLWTPQALGALAQQASWHTDFTLDRSMLALAGDFSGLDEPTRQTVARLNGIAFHLFRFSPATGYDPALLQAIRAEYGALGWKHIATTSARPSQYPGQPPGTTDVWLENHGVNFAGAIVLLSSPTSISLIAVSGDISTIDLLHLRGHFGIPRFSDEAVGQGMAH